MAKPVRHQDLTLTDPVPVDTSYPPVTRIRETFKITIEGQDQTNRYQDLTLTDPVPVDTTYPPIVRTSESFEIGFQIKSRVVVLVLFVLGVAVASHSLLAMNGIVALISGIAVVVAVDRPQYATKIVQWMSDWTGKSKNK